MTKHLTKLLVVLALALCTPLANRAAAAEPGGACCADLDERVSELEASAARKGNRAVSLSISGEVSKALLIWNDGVQSGAYAVDDAAGSEGSKLRLSGEGRMAPGWKAGFVVELGFRDASSLFVAQGNGDGSGETAFETRLANWFIESERAGRLTVGQGASATDGITRIDLSHAPTAPVTWHNRAFGVRYSDGDYTGLTWGDVAWSPEGYKSDFIRYDSPAFFGFVASAAWGENDAWDLALRFQKEISTIRIAAGAGYLWVGDGDAVSLYPNDTVAASGSISVMHVPSGLFGNFAAGRVEIAREALVSPDNPDKGTMWMAQAGIEKRWSPLGATTLYGEYGRYRDMMRGYSDFTGADGGASAIPAASITGTDVSRWGLGAVQQFNTSAMEMYATFNRFDADIRTGSSRSSAEPWYGVVVGSRLKF